jgi:hypothetical protein
MTSSPKCKACGGDMVQKSRLRLIVVGVLMIAALAVAPYIPFLWAPGIILFLAGAYLILWATIGKGLWCRTCKRFSIWPNA